MINNLLTRLYKSIKMIEKMSYSEWERRIAIDGSVAFSSFKKLGFSFFLLCFIMGPVFSKNITNVNSFDNPAGQDKNRILSFDGLSYSIQVYLNSKSQKKIVFLPEFRELLQSKLAEDFQKYFNVYVFPNRNGRNKNIRYLGGLYSRYLKYYLKQFSFYRRQFSTIKSPYVWDILEVNTFITENQDAIIFLTPFSLNKLLDTNIQRIKFNSVVVLSPQFRLLKENLSDFLEGARILWVDSSGGLAYLKEFQKKYGGEYLSYERSGKGLDIFFRNNQAKTDVLNWILSN